MKALRISRLCVVVAMLFGLFAAWSAAVPQQLSTSQELGTSDEGVTGGCVEYAQCINKNPYDCSNPLEGGDPSCTGRYVPDCHWWDWGEVEWSCPIIGYYCDGPSPTCDLHFVKCIQA